MRDDCPLTRNLLDRQDRVLRKAEDRGLDCAALEIETGVSKHTWASYKNTNARAASVMPLSNFLKLAAALHNIGALDLADHLLGKEFNLKPATASDKDWLGFAERASEFTAKVLRYQATDGLIDHREDADLMDDAVRLAADAQSMVAAS